MLDISLNSAIEFAYKNNKDIQIQERDIEYSQGNILYAQSAFLPNLSLNAGYTRNAAVPVTASPGKKDPGVFTGYVNDNSIGTTLTQTVYNGGYNIANLRQSKVNLKISQETLRAKKLDVEFDAKRLYYGLLLAYATTQVNEELIFQAKQHYQDVANKLKEGTATKFDLLQSEVRVALLVPELIKSENSIDIITAEMDKLLGFKVGFALKPKEKLGYAKFPSNESEFLQYAYLNKPEMILKNLGVDLNQWSIQMAKAGYRPQVNADAGYSYHSNNPGNMFNKRHNNWSAGVSLTMPIFDGFSSKAKVDEAKAKYSAAVLEKGNVADQIAVDIRTGCLNLKQSEEVILATKDNVEQAREALKLANANYDYGEGTNLDVLDAQTSLNQIQTNYLQALYDYIMARAFLERTMGKEVLTKPLATKGTINEKRN